ncbi:MAG: TIM barrel protein [Chloroflexota bacterium]
MDISICSFSFHRQLRDGKQDIFKFIEDCQTLGTTYLDPWSGHFEAPGQERGLPPQLDNPTHAEYVDKIKAAGDAVGQPFGCIAIDGTHIYEEDPNDRAENRDKASQWLAVVARLGGKQMRIDTGPRADAWTDDEFDIIVAGYNDLIAEAKKVDVEIVVENHWGPTRFPENTVRILEAVDGLGLLFDTNNWAEGTQERAWEMCAKYAKTMHVKTFSFDENGDDPSVNLRKAINILRENGYNGVWGVESCPRDGNEFEGARDTIALIKRVLSE